MNQGRHQALGLLALSLGFALTGISITLLGPILPALSSRWAMNDAHSGSLFTAQFLGSALGGLLAGLHPLRSATAGFAIAAGGLVSLAFVPASGAIFTTLFFGLGIGMAMTGLNLTAGSSAGARRGTVLSWLNFCWSLGASICPILAALFVTHHLLPTFLATLSISLIVMAVVILARAHDGASTNSFEPRHSRKNKQLTARLIAFFSAVLFLYVGIETTLGGWLSTLAERLPHTQVAGVLTLSASSFFWLALLAGRGLCPLLLKWIPETVIQPAGVALSVVAICFLLRAQTFAGLAFAGILAGLALAPVFPLSLSFFLSHAEQARSAGLVFAICGTGGAVLPWLTGIVSTWTHSLRWAMCVPLLGALVLLMLSFYYVWSLRLRSA